MRKAVLLAVMTLMAAAIPSIQAIAVPPSSRAGCQPDPTLAEQVLHCTYGPLEVTPGANMIMFGPVTIESPRADGYITSFAPNLTVVPSGQVPPIHEVHLHHGVWINAAQNYDTPFFATGEEKTQSIVPPGYGYRTRPTDAWVLNYMLHNLTRSTYTVLIHYDLTWVPLSTPGMKEVVPVWLDAVGNNDSSKAIYPVYDPEQSGAGYTSDQFYADRDVEIVWVGGHVHPGGLRDELRSVTCGGNLLFSSEAVMNQGQESFGSWDYRMTVTPPDWRFRMRRGERLSVTGYYDTTHPWYEAMAIMFAWGHPLSAAEMASSPTPLCASPPTTGAVTPLPDPTNPTPVFGGTGEGTRDYGATGPAASRVSIANFDYQPGGLAQPPATVHAGSLVTFTNFDAAASIFHSVTLCGFPCDGEYGQKYPLAVWPAAGVVDADSGQLGYGPPQATAATQTASWSFAVPSSAAANTLYTYFCRIHPFMRGSLKVVP